MLKILNVVGARPNFMKIAPIMREMQRRPDIFNPVIVHTGQHYDEEMSDAFFNDLGIPEPDFYLDVGSASHAVQTARIMTAFEPVVIAEQPDWVVVVGDVNSTIACALVCSKLGIRVAHVEAGLRSRDRTMPEEINRLLTDAISDLLLTTAEDADANLRAEGIEAKKIRFVGNVMIDSLFYSLENAAASGIREEYGVSEGEYAVVTLHRPSNVDHKATFQGILSALIDISDRLPVIFPAHPRTKSRIVRFGLGKMLRGSGVRLIDPLGYSDFLRLYSGSRLVLTDSGGLQEETTALGIPCVTIRENTERPITITLGTNQLAGTDPKRILELVGQILEGNGQNEKKIPPLWDGKAAVRICDAIVDYSQRTDSPSIG